MHPRATQLLSGRFWDGNSSLLATEMGFFSPHHSAALKFLKANLAGSRLTNPSTKLALSVFMLKRMQKVEKIICSFFFQNILNGTFKYFYLHTILVLKGKWRHLFAFFTGRKCMEFRHHRGKKRQRHPGILRPLKCVFQYFKGNPVYPESEGREGGGDQLSAQL